MPLPNFQDKFGEIPLFSGKDFWKYKKKLGIRPEIDPPFGVIFTFQPKLMNYIIKNYPVNKIDNIFSDFYILEENQERIGICGNFGIGACSVVADQTIDILLDREVVGVICPAITYMAACAAWFVRAGGHTEVIDQVFLPQSLISGLIDKFPCPVSSVHHFTCCVNMTAQASFG